MSKVEFERGGQLQNVTCSLSGVNEPVLKFIEVYVENPMEINFRINNKSLSYISIQEALALRDALNEAVKEAAGL